MTDLDSQSVSKFLLSDSNRFMADSISLRDFIAGLGGLPRQGTLWTDGITLMLDGRGPQNAHLAFPFPVDPTTGQPNHYDREIPLSLDERVYGDHLLLTY